MMRCLFVENGTVLTADEVRQNLIRGLNADISAAETAAIIRLMEARGDVRLIRA